MNSMNVGNWKPSWILWMLKFPSNWGPSWSPWMLWFSSDVEPSWIPWMLWFSVKLGAFMNSMNAMIFFKFRAFMNSMNAMIFFTLWAFMNDIMEKMVIFSGVFSRPSGVFSRPSGVFVRPAHLWDQTWTFPLNPGSSVPRHSWMVKIWSPTKALWDWMMMPWKLKFKACRRMFRKFGMQFGFE